MSNYNFLTIDGDDFSYNIKYSKEDGNIIRVSLPGYAVEFPETDTQLPDELIEAMNDYEWTQKMIERFTKMLLKGPWQNGRTLTSSGKFT
jgi:hypothetical protein